MEVKELIKSKVSLAPMAGITDYVLRSLVRKYSKTCLLTSEMISSEALTQVKDTVITKRDENHSPISYQLSGHKPEMIANCAKYLEQFADMVDINMGCPVGKVVRGNDGCALMRDHSLAYGEWMQEAGADFITIHGRTRNQMYAGNADWKKIAELKKAVDIPVFANGDVTSIETAEKCMEESGADGVAIGRAAIGDASLIYRVEHFFETGERLPVPTLEEKIADFKTHLDEEIALRGENVGIKFVRKFYPFYINGVKNAAKYRSKLVVMDNYDEILKTLDYICKENSEEIIVQV